MKKLAGAARERRRNFARHWLTWGLLAVVPASPSPG